MRTKQEIQKTIKNTPFDTIRNSFQNVFSTEQTVHSAIGIGLSSKFDSDMTTNPDNRGNNAFSSSISSADALLFSQYDQPAIVTFRNSGLTSGNLNELLDINELFQGILVKL
jgi:hypothetical protein